MYFRKFIVPTKFIVTCYIIFDFCYKIDMRYKLIYIVPNSNFRFIAKCENSTEKGYALPLISHMTLSRKRYYSVGI